MNIEEILKENERRRAKWNVGAEYDPIAGDPTDSNRRPMRMSWSLSDVYLPESMIEDETFRRSMPKNEYEMLRCRHDFEFWAARCVKIRHKNTGEITSFVLNAPQRRVARLLEADRREERPIRLVMLKARQWGGSTLVQMYFAWIQILHRRNWNSLICAQVSTTAAAIRAMYRRMLDEYPQELWDEEDAPALRPWQRQVSTLEIAGRDSRVSISSSFSPDAVRGLDFSMAHLSEVAFWKDSELLSPEDFARNVCSGVPMVPCSMIVMESTANGVGNYFHSQWVAAESGRSSYRAVFVPWYEIDIYRSECDDPAKLISELTPYEKGLWERGLTLEMIQWYHNKCAESPSPRAMMTEFPTDAVEAFVMTGRGVFSAADIEKMRGQCTQPVDVDAQDDMGLILPAGDGVMKVWSRPRSGRAVDGRYVVSVDVGGRSINSDYSVVSVFDRYGGSPQQPKPEVVAQWRGHCDHDLLARLSAQIGRAYGNALLVIESNTLESANAGASQYILEELNHSYPNLYVRTILDAAEGYDMVSRVGFHTNRLTKDAMITAMIGLVRSGGYIERDADALAELAAYEQKQNGSFGARKGCHDDILMSRAIGLYVMLSMPRPMESPEIAKYVKKTITGSVIRY